MAAQQEEDVYLQVKKYTFLSASGCQDRAITDLILQNLHKDSSDEELDEDSVKWLRVERLNTDGECVVFEKIYEQPQNVHTRIRKDSDCSFQYLIDAEGLMEEVDPKLHVSALVTGLGAYIIAFPLHSFAEDAPETSRLDLVREICDSVSVIKEGASEVVDQKPQVILLGMHKGTVDSTEVARRQEVASDLLKQKLLGDEGNCNFVYPPKSGIVWAHDMSNSSSLLGVLDENVAEVEVSLRPSWIEAYVSSGDTPNAKKLSKPVSKERYKRDIERKLKVKMTEEELEKLLHSHHVLGWLVTHKENVFSQAYLCKVIRCLPNKKGRINDKKIGMMLADKGLAVKFLGEQFIVPSVLTKNVGIPRRSAAPFYLALVKGHHTIIPISISAFWRMVNTVLEEKPWDCDSPNFCNYISLQYGETYCVHVSFIGGVIEVAVEKPLQVEGPQAKIVKVFAEKCQEIQKSLSDALIKIVGEESGKVKWGFACEEDHLIDDPSSRCVSVTACDKFKPDEYRFVCPRNPSHNPTLTLRHKVWFLREIHEKYQLQADKDRGVYVIPDKLDQFNTDPESNNPSSRVKYCSFTPDERPSDVALIAIKPKVSNWTSLAIALGVESSFVGQCSTDYKDPTFAYMCAMTVWRNGDRGTWKHLLEAIGGNEGSLVSDEIEADAKKRVDWTNKSH